jgi:hypothetical protein
VRYGATEVQLFHVFDPVALAIIVFGPPAIFLIGWLVERSTRFQVWRLRRLWRLPSRER